MKRLTKKELEAIQELEQERKRLRREMMEALENYWQDVAAMERVAKLNGKSGIQKETKDKLFSNYEVIKDLTKNQINILRELIFNERDRKEYYKGYGRMKEILPQDAIWLSDSITFNITTEGLLEQFKLLKRIGIKKIYYTNTSTTALDDMVWLFKIGAKIIGITNISDSNEGLIIEL
ncbi:MAG: hypothetical protein ACI3T9_00875 [Romboutsia timonensis]